MEDMVTTEKKRGSGFMGMFKRRDSKGRESSPNHSGDEYEMAVSPLHQQPLLKESAGALTNTLTRSSKKKSGYRQRTPKRKSLQVTYSQLEQRARNHYVTPSPLSQTTTSPPVTVPKEYYAHSNLPQHPRAAEEASKQSTLSDPDLKLLEQMLYRITNKIDYLAGHIIRTDNVVLETRQVMDGIVVDYGDEFDHSWWSQWFPCCFG
jgi:hypothetical protein